MVSMFRSGLRRPLRREPAALAALVVVEVVVTVVPVVAAVSGAGIIANVGVVGVGVVERERVVGSPDKQRSGAASRAGKSSKRRERDVALAARVTPSIRGRGTKVTGKERNKLGKKLGSQPIPATRFLAGQCRSSKRA